MAWSCATWFREPCQVRKEAAVSGVPGAPQPTGPEWSALRARATLQREGVRGQFCVCEVEGCQSVCDVFLTTNVSYRHKESRRGRRVDRPRNFAAVQLRG